MKISEAFSVLNVPPGATAEEVERAYRSLAMRVHPDRRGGNTKRMVQLNAARDLLAATAAQFAGPELDGIKKLIAHMPVQELHRIRAEILGKIRSFTQRDPYGVPAGALNSPELGLRRKELAYIEARLALAVV